MHTLRSTLAVAVATILEAFRNRLFAITVILGLALVATSILAATVSISERSRLIVDVGLSAASGLGTVIAIALSVTNFCGELRNHTAYPILARPIPRWAFVLGKFTGVFVTLIGVTTILVLSTAATVLLYGGDIPEALWGCLWLSWLEMAVISALTFCFSAIAVPALAASYSVGTVLAGNLATDVQRYGERLVERGNIGGHIIRGAYAVLPDLQDLSGRIEAANDLELPWSRLLDATAYGSAYSAAILILTMWIFERRRAL